MVELAERNLLNENTASESLEKGEDVKASELLDDMIQVTRHVSLPNFTACCILLCWSMRAEWGRPIARPYPKPGPERLFKPFLDNVALIATVTLPSVAYVCKLVCLCRSPRIDCRCGDVAQHSIAQHSTVSCQLLSANPAMLGQQAFLL